MKAITVRDLPPAVGKAIRRKAQAEGLSLNRTVVKLLEEATGHSIGPDSKAALHHDLDHLAGTWTEDEYDEFMESLREQRRIDPEMWR